MNMKNHLNGKVLQFQPTGNPHIDAILYAVVEASTGYHNANEWDEPGMDGEPSYVELIQRAADEAADVMDNKNAS
jgi:hypothetical protein